MKYYMVFFGRHKVSRVDGGELQLDIYYSKCKLKCRSPHNDRLLECGCQISKARERLSDLGHQRQLLSRILAAA